MTPVLYPASETAFTSNGLGRLSDAASCEVTEELNGAFELEITYPPEGAHAPEIVEGAIIMAPHDESGDMQPFRVYRRADVIDGVFTAYARHLAYDLTRIPVMPYTAASCSAALTGLSGHVAVTCPFTFSTDIVKTGSFVLEVPASAKAVLGDGEGSILGLFGGEVKYDRWAVSVLSRRGADKPVTIRYGKNMTGLEVVSEASAAYNAVVPYCKTQEGVVVCSPPVVAHGAYTDALPLDLSDAFDYVPSPAQLQTAALSWLNEHQPWVAERAINVSFVELWQTEEYKNVAPLQTVVLGDGVTVTYSKLGVDADFRIVKTVFDVLRGRYAGITLGRESVTVATMISELIRKVEEARDIAQEIANGTYGGGTFINGNLIYAPSIYGGQIYIGQRQGGGYNFRVDSSGNIETAGGMTAKGAYAIRADDETPGAGTLYGYMGRASGSDGVSATHGVALCGPGGNPASLGSQSNYVIVTNAGARMQAGGHSLWVASGGAAYDGQEIATKEYVDMMIASAMARRT